MKMQSVSEGDLVLLPLNTGESAICRVLYKSGYFRNVILLGIYGKYDPAQVLQAGSNPLELIYCGSTSIKNRKWPCIGNLPLSEDEKGLSKRIVGGDVWVGDECLGGVAGENATLPKMSVFGDKVLLRAVERAITG
jgi:hypothetical protein